MVVCLPCQWRVTARTTQQWWIPPVVILTLTGTNRIRSSRSKKTRFLEAETSPLVKIREREAESCARGLQGGFKGAFRAHVRHLSGVCVRWTVPPLLQHPVCFYSCIVGRHRRAAPAPSCQTRLLGVSPRRWCGAENYQCIRLLPLRRLANA